MPIPSRTDALSRGAALRPLALALLALIYLVAVALSPALAGAVDAEHADIDAARPASIVYVPELHQRRVLRVIAPLSSDELGTIVFGEADGEPQMMLRGPR